MSRPDIIAANRLRGSSMLSSSDTVSRSASMRSSARMSATCAIVLRSTRAADRVALGVVGVQQAFRRCPIDHLGQLPAQIHRILHAGVEALSTDRGMHVRRVAGQQDPSVAVGRGLPGHVGEPGDPGGTVDPVVGPVDGDEALAEIAQGGLARADLRLGQHDPDRPALLVDHLAVLDLVLDLAQGMHARGSAADAQFRLLGHLDLGEQGARRRIPAGELDAGCLADQAASSVAPDEILRPQRLAVGQLRRRRRCRPARSPVTSRPR